MNIELLKFLAVSLFPVLLIWLWFLTITLSRNKKNMNNKIQFKVWNRDLEFNLDSKEITYKDKIFTPSIRTLWDMKDLYHSDFEKLKDEKWLYFMYRDVYFEELDKVLLDDNKIRYDITILLSHDFWGEYNKTYWHYHPKNSEWKHFQELYQILYGTAIYLQQNEQKTIFTKANTHDAVNMDESFGHVTINPSDKDILIMANLVDADFDSVYDDYKEKKWARYMYFKNDIWQKNDLYKDDIILEESSSKFDSSDSIYDDFLQNQEKFNYLH